MSSKAGKQFPSWSMTSLHAPQTLLWKGMHGQEFLHTFCSLLFDHEGVIKTRTLPTWERPRRILVILKCWSCLLCPKDYKSGKPMKDGLIVDSRPCLVGLWRSQHWLGWACKEQFQIDLCRMSFFHWLVVGSCLLQGVRAVSKGLSQHIWRPCPLFSSLVHLLNVHSRASEPIDVETS